MPNKVVEIISVGNELLTGHTVNTNASWIAKQVTCAGGTVRRVTIVRDEIDVISSSIREVLGRKADWLVISGGLGPTYDDKTLQGLAGALGQKLFVNREAVLMLRRKYSKTRDPTLTGPRMKMATIPKKAKPLDNPIGHAAGVLVKHGSCTIFSLPGVPVEMMAIFSTHVLPLLKHGIGKMTRMEVNIETVNVAESLLAPYLDRVVANNRRVYVKSHPRGFRKGVPMLDINISCEASSKSLAKRYLRKAVKEMKQSVIDAGGSVKEI